MITNYIIAFYFYIIIDLEASSEHSQKQLTEYIWQLLRVKMKLTLRNPETAASLKLIN